MNQSRAENQIHSASPKPPRLIESATSDPIRVITEVFNSIFIEELRDDLLPKWLRTALINDNSIYTNTDQRSALLVFYDQLILLAEAMQVISIQHSPPPNNPELAEDRQPLLLTEEQLSNPLLVVAAFRQQFSLEYIRRELWHFLEAGITHPGDYPDGFAPGYALMTYDFILCLTEAAYSLGD